MKMNQRMSALLRCAGVPVPFGDSLGPGPSPLPALAIVGEFVLLKDPYKANRHIRPQDLPDKTGYECLINHIHLPFDGTGDSLKSSLKYAVALHSALAQMGKNRRFQVILSVNEQECTVRFHQLRQGESWIAEDLEGYAEEAVLLLRTDLMTAGDRP
jgi:hypothetical protein